jgi:O-antigen ligase
MPVFFVLAVIIGVIVTRSEKVANHFITIFSPEETSEFQWRQLVWENALEKITVNPWIGSGTDSAFTVVDWNGVETSYSAHNLLIGLAYELGVLNLIIFLLFLASLFRSAWRCVKYAPLPSDRLLAIGFIAVGVSFLVSGVGSALMNIENIAALFWLMVGLAVTLRREARQYYRRIQEVPHENSDGRIPAMATSN